MAMSLSSSRARTLRRWGSQRRAFYVDPTTGKPTWKNYYPGSVNITSGKITADVIDDPSQLFIIQADEDIEQADIGKNADVVGTGGSTTTGVSTMNWTRPPSLTPRR
jgi:hypothetical protein